MKRRNLTPEQIAALHDRNEHFRGKYVSLTKVRAYEAVKSILTELMEEYPEVISIKEDPPARRKQNALIFMDIYQHIRLRKEDMEKLALIAEKVDDLFVSLTETGFRVSVGFQHVWMDGHEDEWDF